MLRAIIATLFPKDTAFDGQASHYGERLSEGGGARDLRPISRRMTGRLRRSTLVTLRWTAITGQVVAIIVVAYVLGFSFLIWPCVIVIGLSAFINIIVAVSLPLDRRVGDWEAAAQLGFDLLQLSALIGLTGGMSNPFALLLLAPVVTGATTLSRRVLIILGILATGLSFGLLYTSYPLPWSPTGEFELPFIYSLGAWVALLVGAVFTSLYAWRAAKESRRMSEALAATEAVLAHEQKLSALGGLAAAAAHELGTPLATIQVTAKEMSRELAVDTPLGEDARLMLSQAKRCRDILQQLAMRGDEGDVIHDQLSIESVLEEAVQPFIGIKGIGPSIEILVSGDGPMPQIKRQAELLYGLKNFIENAVDFAGANVKINGIWSDTKIAITIEDDGPGFDPTVRERLGEPYVTRREGRRPSADEMGGDGLEKAGGLGLGVFIAKTLIERTGGRVNFARATVGGAKVTLTWPRNRLSPHQT